MSNRIKKKTNTKSSFQEVAAFILGIFVICILCLLPVVFTDYYFNILETKYLFYCAVSCGMIVILLVCGLYSGKAIAFIKEGKFKTAWRSLSFVDWAMIAFWLSNLISWILSEWHYDAFWGTFGRYNGLSLMTLYLLVYFMTTRFFHMRRWYLDAFLCVGIFVSIFGITDYFQMDILGFKVNMVPEQKTIYTSTFGNINTYTVYEGLLTVISMLLFCQEREQKRMLWYLGNLILSLFALIMGTSDNAYLMLAAFFGLSPLYLFASSRGVRRYLISAAVLFTVIWAIVGINHAYADTVVGIESLFSLAERFSGFLAVLVIALWILAGAVSFFLLKREKEKKTETTSGWLIIAWLAVVVIVVLAVVFVFVDANLAGHADRYGAMEQYVVFSDTWGTNRGYVWSRCMTIFKEHYTALQKLFGYGPDMLRVIFNIYYPTGRGSNLTVDYDSAHNEYLHYMMTIGIAGMLSYLAFLGGAIVRLAKRAKERPECAAILFAIAAYAVQALVNINLPIATPIVIQLLAMGVGRSTEPDKK